MHDGRSLGLIAASIGVAALPNHGMNERDLIQAAEPLLVHLVREHDLSAEDLEEIARVRRKP